VIEEIHGIPLTKEKLGNEAYRAPGVCRGEEVTKKGIDPMRKKMLV